MTLPPDAWEAVATGITTVGAVWIAHVRQRSAQRKASAKVEEVRRLSAPTGNGFAGSVTAALARIEKSQDELCERQRRTNAALMGHLSDHARADITHHDRPGGH